LTAADGEYRRASEAIAYLPGAFGRTVAVAAAVYRGIHDEVRRAGYDNLTRRAVTALPRKCVLAVSALRQSGVRTATAYSPPVYLRVSPSARR